MFLAIDIIGKKVSEKKYTTEMGFKYMDFHILTNKNKVTGFYP